MCLMVWFGEMRLFRSPCDSSLGKVVNGNFNRDLIAGEDLDIIHTQLTRNVGGNDVPVGKLDLEYGIGQCL